MIVVFDTETTGFVGGIVQLAYRIVTPERELIKSVNNLIKQDNPIPSEATAIHGKTDAMCAEFGLDLKEVMEEFRDDITKCDKIVAHNISFDLRMIEQDMVKSGVSYILPADAICTAELFRDICKLPPTPNMINAGRLGHKTPKLIEAYTHIMGHGFDNAHDAMADVLACEELYFHWLLNFAGNNKPQKKSTPKATKKDVAVVTKKPVTRIFTDRGISRLKSSVELKIASFAETPLNMDVKKDRDSLRSFSANIASFKVKIDKIGKSILDNMKKPIEEQEKRIKATRDMIKKCVDMLQKQQDDTRKPLTEYEQAEKKRIEAIQVRIRTIKEASNSRGNIEQIEAILEKIEAVNSSEFQEFEQEAVMAIACTKETLQERVSFMKREAELKIKEQELERQRIAQEIEDQANALAQEKVIEAEAQKRVASATHDVTSRYVLPDTAPPPPVIDRQTIRSNVMIAISRHTDMTTAQAITKAILGGEIPHISIDYGA